MAYGSDHSRPSKRGGWGCRAACAVGLGCLLLGAAVGPAVPVPELARLAAATMRLREVKLEEKGAVKVEAVRRRMGALAALTGSARPLVRGRELATRLQAHLLIAEAHEAFATELFSAKAPPAARGEAARAWTDQVQTTIERAMATARAHLRSCVDLVKVAAPEPDPGCASALERLGAGRERASAHDASAVARLRMEELQVCFDVAQAERSNPDFLEMKALLAVDRLGRVESVELSPRREDQRGLYDCVADGLWLWTFPGLSDVEIELPLRLAAPRR